MSNTLLKLYLTEKDFGCKKNDKDNVGIAGATNEVATLKEAVAAAEHNAAAERTEREKQEARVAEVQQELQDLVKKHESLERDSKTRESELATALESAKAAKAEAYKARQEIEALKKITAGKAFFMQSKHVSVNYLSLTRIRSSPGAFCPAACLMLPLSIGPRRGARRRRSSSLSMLRPDIRYPLATS